MKKILIFLLILVIIAVLVLGYFMGWFDGLLKKGSSDSGTESTVERVIESASDTSGTDDSDTRSTVSVKVSGTGYVYNGKEYTLEELKSEINSLDKNKTIIEVVDDNAVANAIQNLHDYLKEAAFDYSDSKASDSSSVGASQAE